ncbi:nacht and ankyrin protein [Fusarium langsethiae]|uniref:Nacht and ankyrin protein n=1 Tax=Fusarium langsethiae TaxID=179993 RepID=A0A0M9ENR6_FUSLA|nr:nacht and ankyrin protein [Fusarium langsethiae]
MIQHNSSEDYIEVAVVCALTREYDAMSRFGQFEEEEMEEITKDYGAYRYGRMDSLHLVLASPSKNGRAAMTVMATFLRSRFRNLKLVILTGICGGIPSAVTGHDLLFGDVVVDPRRLHAGGQVAGIKIEQDSGGCSTTWARGLRSAIETDDCLGYFKARIMDFLKQLQQAAPAKYKYPGAGKDRLYQHDYPHFCEQCRMNQNLACYKRDNLGTKGTVAIEMEADAVCEVFPCIVIKGVSDYADSHKNDAYQDYASATAASATMVMLVILERLAPILKVDLRYNELPRIPGN